MILSCRLNVVSLICCSGRGVVHPSFRSYRPSREDGRLHLLLPEEGGGPAALRGKQSRTYFQLRTVGRVKQVPIQWGLVYGRYCLVLVQGITFKRVGVPTANDIIKSSSRDAVRSVHRIPSHIVAVEVSSVKLLHVQNITSSSPRAGSWTLFPSQLSDTSETLPRS